MKNMPMWMCLCISALLVIWANFFTGTLSTLALGAMSVLAVFTAVFIPAVILLLCLLRKVFESDDFAEHLASDPDEKLDSFREMLAAFEKIINRDKGFLLRVGQWALALCWLFTFASHGLIFMTGVYLIVIFSGYRFRKALPRFYDSCVELLAKVEKLRAPVEMPE